MLASVRRLEACEHVKEVRLQSHLRRKQCIRLCRPRGGLLLCRAHQTAWGMYTAPAPAHAIVGAQRRLPKRQGHVVTSSSAQPLARSAEAGTCMHSARTRTVSSNKAMICSLGRPERHHGACMGDRARGRACRLSCTSHRGHPPTRVLQLGRGEAWRPRRCPHCARAPRASASRRMLIAWQREGCFVRPQTQHRTPWRQLGLRHFVARAPTVPHTVVLARLRRLEGALAAPARQGSCVVLQPPSGRAWKSQRSSAISADAQCSASHVATLSQLACLRTWSKMSNVMRTAGDGAAGMRTAHSIKHTPARVCSSESETAQGFLDLAGSVSRHQCAISCQASPLANPGARRNEVASTAPVLQSCCRSSRAMSCSPCSLYRSRWCSWCTEAAPRSPLSSPPGGGKQASYELCRR